MAEEELILFQIKHWENSKKDTKSGFQHRDANLGHILNARRNNPHYFETIQMIVSLASGGNESFYVYEGRETFTCV
jgi:hypothetical protein